jgi:hypothetical protein
MDPKARQSEVAVVVSSPCGANGTLVYDGLVLAAEE